MMPSFVPVLKRLWPFLALLLALLWLFPSPARTEGGGPRFHFSGQTFSKADVDGGGTYSRTQTRASVGYQWLTLAYTRSDYDWSHTKKAFLGKSRGGTPWDRLQRVAVDASFRGEWTDSVGWFAGGTLVSGFEEQLSDSFSIVGRGGLSWMVNFDLTLRIGAIGSAAPVHSLLIPLIEIDWRDPADYGFSAHLGVPASSLSYRFNDLLAARAAVSWNRELYRLADDSSVARKGYVEDSGFTTGAYLDLTPLGGLTVTVGAELLANRSLRIYDHNGDRLSKTDVDNALGAVFRVGYNF